MTFKNRIILKSNLFGQLIENFGRHYIRNTENFYNFKNHVRKGLKFLVRLKALGNMNISLK